MSCNWNDDEYQYHDDNDQMAFGARWSAAHPRQPRPLFTCPLALLAWTGVVAVWVYIVAAWVLA